MKTKCNIEIRKINGNVFSPSLRLSFLCKYEGKAHCAIEIG